MSKMLRFGMAVAALSTGLSIVPVSANAPDADGVGTIPVNITVEPTPINVSVPTSIDIAVAANSVDGVVADTNVITNNANAGVILVDSITAKRVRGEGWIFQDSTFDFVNDTKNSRNIYIGSKLEFEDDFVSLKTEYKPTNNEILPKTNRKVEFKVKTNAVSIETNEEVAMLSITVSQK